MALLPELPARSGCLARGRVEPGGKQNENKAWGEAAFIPESLAAIHEERLLFLPHSEGPFTYESF